MGVLLSADDPERFDRLAVVAPYMRLEAEPAPPSPEWLDALRTDWSGFIVPFMHSVFNEPDSADVIAEMIAIGLEATPEVVVTQQREIDWQRPARVLGQVMCPTLVVHGENGRLEVTGNEGGPIVVEGRPVVGLADVISLARELGQGHLFGLPPSLMDVIDVEAEEADVAGDLRSPIFSATLPVPPTVGEIR